MILRDNEKIDSLEIGDLKIIQNTKYFCFGMDSVLLANFASSNSSKNVIVDLCSGSSVIPIIVNAKKKCSKIFGIELQPEMFDLFKRNVILNNLQDKIVGINDNIKNISNIRNIIIDNMGSDKVDIVICNPPYKEVGTGVNSQHEVNDIARNEILCNLEDIFNTSSKLLKHKGKLYIVHKPQRLADLITLGRQYSLEPKTLKFIYPRVNQKPSIVLIEYIKNGGRELNILEPIIEFDENGDYTKDIYDIYGVIKKGG